MLAGSNTSGVSAFQGAGLGAFFVVVHVQDFPWLCSFGSTYTIFLAFVVLVGLIEAGDMPTGCGF